MEKPSDAINTIGNDPFFAKLFIIVTSAIFLLISLYYYTQNPLNIYHFIGLKTILLTLFVLFFFIILLVVYYIYFDDNDVYYKSKSLWSFVSMFAGHYFYYFIVSLLMFYVFMRCFTYFQNSPDSTETLMTYILWTTIILLFFMTLSTFYSISLPGSGKKSKKFPYKDVYNVIKQAAYYSSCFMNDTIDFLKNDLQNTNTLSLYILIFFFVSIFFYHVIPKVLIYVLLYDGKQLLNAPVYINKETYLTSFEDLNNEIISGNIFKYTNQYIYDTYTSYFQTQESYINLKDPALEYELNKKIESIKDKIDDNMLKQMIESDPTFVDNIQKMMDDPDFMQTYLLSLTPFQGEYMEKVVNYINNLNTVKTDKTVDEMVGPSMKYNYNYTDQINYNYAISCWVFIDNYTGNNSSSDTDTDKTIIKFGDKLNMVYNPFIKQIKVISQSCYSNLENEDEENEKNEDRTCITKIAFRSKNILFQKWNHVVLNYDSGTLDVFINNKLVSSTPSISPYTKNDGIYIGSNDGVEGAICNVMYFSNSLSKSEINKIYSFFYTSTPPIL